MTAPLRPATDPVAELPVLILYPHAGCNCRCLMCDTWRARSSSEIHVERARSWSAEWRSLAVRRVVLSGGEPLMHSEIGALLDVLAGAGLKITLVSSGILLSEHAEVVARCCDSVVVSLDGPESVYERIRRVAGGYAKLGEGIRALRAAGADVLITARCTVQRENYRHLCDTVRSAQALGIDRISFLAVDTSSDAFDRAYGRGRDRVRLCLVPAEGLSSLADELAALKRDFADDFASGFIVESPAKLERRILDYFRAVHGETEFPVLRCNAPWVSAVVESDGTARPCFFHPPYGRLGPPDDLGSLLNHDRSRAFRRSLDVATDPTCRRCVCNLVLAQGEDPR